MTKANKGDRNEFDYVARDKRGLTEHVCELCDKHFGWVYEFDLNESHFYCDECYKNIPDYYFPN